ncbi:DUF927 domain-containing protein [Halomonas sp.]|uniref:DUF927 domain-containing protein n=1 Tax=Halomonas sp. TaxID=1486246 RepID=UPI003569CDE8
MTVNMKKVWSLAGGQTHIKAPSRTHSKYTTIESALADALVRYGVKLSPKASGRFERFDSPDKPKGNSNGWYRIHSPQVASFGIWHLDLNETVTLNGSSDPKAAAQARLEAMRVRDRRDRERQQREAEAKEMANRWWPQAGPANPTFPYLAGKGLPPFNLRQRGDVLLMPMYFEGESEKVKEPRRTFATGSLATAIIFQSEFATQDDFATAGNLERWRESIGALCRDNLILVLAVSTALAGLQRGDRARRAIDLFAAGASRAQISEVLGVSHATAGRWIWEVVDCVDDHLPLIDAE